MEGNVVACFSVLLQWKSASEREKQTWSLRNTKQRYVVFRFRPSRFNKRKSSTIWLQRALRVIVVTHVLRYLPSGVACRQIFGLVFGRCSVRMWSRRRLSWYFSRFSSVLPNKFRCIASIRPRPPPSKSILVSQSYHLSYRPDNRSPIENSSLVVR